MAKKWIKIFQKKIKRLNPNDFIILNNLNLNQVKDIEVFEEDKKK